MVGNRKRSCPRIGLLFVTTRDVGQYHGKLWAGVVDEAQEHKIDLLCFAGGTLGGSTAQNVAYGLVDPEELDGLIIEAAIGDHVSAEAFEAFVEQYRSIPLVSIGFITHDIPNVVIDDEKGLHDALAHLIEAHDHDRIAFIKGPATSESAEARYETYRRVLIDYQLSHDSALVVPGDFMSSAGAEAIRLLVDERQVAFDAVLAANDAMAVGAVEALQARGVRVPQEVAVVGFDDADVSAALTPALTTVRRPVYAQGRKALEMLLALMAGEAVQREISLPTELVVRRSCGCLLPSVVQAGAEDVPAAANQSVDALAAHQEEIHTGVMEMLQAQAAQLTQDQAERLVAAFLADLEGESSEGFLLALEDVLGQASSRTGFQVWQQVLSALRSRALPYLKGDARLRAEALWHQGRVLIGDMIHQADMRHALDVEQLNAHLRELSHQMDVATGMPGLVEILAREWPQLGIPSGYFALFDGDEVYPGLTEPAEHARLLLAYDENGQIDIEPGGIRYPSRDLLPAGMLRSDGQTIMIVGPLDDMVGACHGFLVLEVGPREGLVYAALQEQLASTVQRLNLIQQSEERNRALQEANYALQRRAIQVEASAEIGQAITSIFDVEELLSRTVALISERFGFYHVGIFLLDEEGEWLVLQEATGEAGAQMMEDGHRLAVEDTSMVGWTALHRQPRIALDVGEDAVHFAHPLLPLTRSEMTLPLLVGDRLIGVLNVQSTEEAAFDRDDVRTLQSMADQVAVALENAQRVSDEAALLEATSPIYRASRLLTTATTTKDVADAIIASVAETGADGCTVVGFEFSPTEEPIALLYLGVWRRDREPQFQPGLRLPIEESPFPIEMVSTLWSVADVNLDDRLPRSARVVFQATGARALVNIPLRSGERVIGQVVVIRGTPGPFQDPALRLYEVLSDQAAVALERAQLLEETQERAAREQSTRQMIDRIRGATDVADAMEAAAEELAQAMAVPHVSIDLGSFQD